MAILATLLAPVLLYFIFRTAAVGFMPVAALQLPPVQQGPLLRLKIYETLHPERRVAPDLVETARTAAIEQPLDYQPFFILARAAEQAGQIDRAIRLLEVARERRSSFVPTRLQLAVYYGQRGRFLDMMGELESLLRLSEKARSVVIPELAKLIENPQGRPVLAAALAERPGWRTLFFEHALTRTFRPEDTRALLEAVRARRPNADLTLEQRLYIKSLADAGDVQRARQLWLQLLPAAERERHRYLFDGSFRGVPAHPPFTWSLHERENGRAEVSRSEGRAELDVDYFGGSSGLFAEQVLALAPGRYRLTFSARSQEDPTAGALHWIVTCLGNRQEIGRVQVKPGREFRRNEVSFSVPASGCAGQKLGLYGDPGDVATPMEVQIANVDISK